MAIYTESNLPAASDFATQFELSSGSGKATLVYNNITDDEVTRIPINLGTLSYPFGLPADTAAATYRIELTGNAWFATASAANVGIITVALEGTEDRSGVIVSGEGTAWVAGVKVGLNEVSSFGGFHIGASTSVEVAKGSVAFIASTVGSIATVPSATNISTAGQSITSTSLGFTNTATEEFDGDGTTTDFTISETPLAGSVTATVGGVDTAVTVSGTTVTFATAPATGTDNVDISYSFSDTRSEVQVASGKGTATLNHGEDEGIIIRLNEVAYPIGIDADSDTTLTVNKSSIIIHQ